MTQPDGYMFYRDRPEWCDVKLLPLEDVNVPICQIAYSDKYIDIFSYYKAVIASGEKSERVFELVTDAIDQNLANYSLWSHRRELLDYLNKDLNVELKFVSKLILNDLKVYQLWYHRMELIKILNSPDGEFEFCDVALIEDTKNYHAWQYRYWLLDYFKMWNNTQEMQKVEQLLKEDPYNNSVWNFRFQILLHNNELENQATLKAELQYTVDHHLQINPDNECAWNYLTGLFKYVDTSTQLETIEKFKEQLNFDDFPPSNNDLRRLKLDFVVHYYYNHQDTDKIHCKDFTVKSMQMLANIIDPVRKGYWEFLQSQLSSPITTC